MKRQRATVPLLVLLGILGAARPAVATTEDRVDQFFDSDGVKLRYRVVGDGTPVVLIHGFVLTIEANWTPVLDSAPDGFQLIALDIRGHGKSPKPHEPDAYGIQLVEDVRRLLDHLEIQSAHVVGHSLGASIALKFATVYPERVKSLVVTGAGLGPEVDELRQRLNGLATSLETSDSVVEALMGDPPPPNITAEQLEIVAANDRLALAALCRSLTELYVTPEEIAGIDKPLLAVIGENDRSMPEVEALKAVATQTEIVIIKGQGHDAFTTPEFVAAIERFLNQVEGDQAK